MIDIKFPVRVEKNTSAVYINGDSDYYLKESNGAILLRSRNFTLLEEICATLNAANEVREYCTNGIVAGSPFADEILAILDGGEK